MSAVHTQAAQELDVQYLTGEAYEVSVRGHRVRVDQPAEVGGDDTAVTPTELFIASLATCVAFYAGRYLTRHGYSREGLAVSVEYELAKDRPARVAAVHINLQVPPDLPAKRRPALHAVASRCTVHNSLIDPPSVIIALA